MAHRARDRITRSFSIVLTAGIAAAGCRSGKSGPALSKGDDQVFDVAVPPEEGPRLGATAQRLPIRARPSPTAAAIGWLRAGATIARAAEPFSSDGCDDGWYPVRPRGFVCLSDGATLDLKHPTLQVMSIAPKLDAVLPYTYARTRKKTTVWEHDPKRPDGIREAHELPRRSGLAVVGSWTATDPAGASHRLALMTTGTFVDVDALEAASASSFKGVLLDAGAPLAHAFVVKQGVRSWRIDDGAVDKLDKLDFHDTLTLTGKFRTVEPVKYWGLDDGRYVRHQDVTVVRPRHVYPDFASDDQKWIDVSIITGTLVLYEGKRPVYATLASVGRDRTGDPATTASTAQGTFEVVAKHVTVSADAEPALADELKVHDVPWALQLSSGQMLHGAYWHDRFGIEFGLGHVQLSVADAAHVWQWVEPQLPSGWHGVALPQGGKKTFVIVRK